MFNYILSATEIATLNACLEKEKNVLNATIRLCNAEVSINRYKSSPSFNQRHWDKAGAIIDEALGKRSTIKEIVRNKQTDIFYKYNVMGLDQKHQELFKIFEKRKNHINTARSYLDKNPSIYTYFYEALDNFGYGYLLKIIIGDSEYYKNNRD